jgi:hypothetical protein
VTAEGDEDQALCMSERAPPDDRFYKGVILRVYPGRRSGILRTGNGREIVFVAPDVEILGTTHGFTALREGMRVGFDLGWTSRGVRVSRIRVYEAADSP